MYGPDTDESDAEEAANTRRAQIRTLEARTRDTTEADAAAQCIICLDHFGVGERAIVLPCAHMHHWECIAPWLVQKLLCPTCKGPAAV